MDGSTNSQRGNGGIGGIIRDINRNWIIWFMGNPYSSTSTLDKLKALEKGLRLVIEHKLYPLEISIVSVKMLQYLKTDYPTFSKILTV